MLRCLHFLAEVPVGAAVGDRARIAVAHGPCVERRRRDALGLLRADGAGRGVDALAIVLIDSKTPSQCLQKYSYRGMGAVYEAQSAGALATSRAVDSRYRTDRACAHAAAGAADGVDEGGGANVAFQHPADVLEQRALELDRQFRRRS